MTQNLDYNGFKVCANCGAKWKTRHNFLSDLDIELTGYQSNFVDLTAGLFYFNHSCGNTLVLYSKAFLDLYDGPIFEERSTGGEKCPDYCLHREELRICPAKCECAYVREIMSIVKNWPKETGGTNYGTPT